VADVYEALTSDRPYRDAFSDEDALDLMRLDVPARLDVDAFRALETTIT
jgi:HD-GYP domain-containing protein (c-di-GMP phosphodiesterase class II)